MILVAFYTLNAGTLVFGQPGPLITLQNSNLLFSASTLLTNGVPGITNPPLKLMVSAVLTNSALGGRVVLAVTQAWVKRFNGPFNNEDQALHVVVDNDGNIVVTGYSQGSGTGADFLTLKYAPDGTALWTNRYDGEAHGSDKAELAAVDGANNVYVSGESRNLSGGSDIVTVKYSAGGEPVWTNRYVGSPSGFILLSGLTVDAAGNAYVLPSDFDIWSFIIVKYDSNGNPAWTNLFNVSPTSQETAYAIALDATGHVFVTGSSFDNGADNFATVKLAGDGTGLWTNRYSLVGLESGTMITVDRQGNVIVVGDSQGGTAQHKYPIVKYSNAGAPLWTNVMSAPSYAGGGVPTLAADVSGNVLVTGGTANGSSTSADFTTIKFSSTGTPLWTNRFIYPSSAGPFLHGTAVDNAGNFYLACDSTPLGGGNYDYGTFKCSGGGVPLWTNRYNGPANASDNPRHIATDAAGNVYVAGTSSGSGSSFSALDFVTVKYADNVRYTPPTNVVGIDTFSFAVVDYFGNVGTGTVTVALLPLNLQFNTVATNLQRTTQGFKLQVDGARGTNPVVIYASTNLVEWVSIFTNLPTLGSVPFLDFAGTNLLKRFYRASQFW